MLQIEHQMYGLLEEHFTQQGLVVLREVTTSEGRVDVVGARVDWNAAIERRRLGLTGALVRPSLLHAWEVLPRVGRLSGPTWAERLAVSFASIRAIARDLENLGYIDDAHGLYGRRAGIPSVLMEIVCCEAKLDDWRRGLAQAYGHRFYADRIYLALANQIPRTLDLGLVQERRVGLLSVTDRVTTNRVAPRRRAPDKIARRHLEELFWRDAIEPALARRRQPITLSTLLSTA